MRARGSTDLDLSVALYDDEWRYLCVCSYYELKFTGPSQDVIIAQSAGDLRDAPFPDGATEFVDLHVGPALQSKIRFAVMVVTAYAGLPFTALERARRPRRARNLRASERERTDSGNCSASVSAV